VPFGPIDTAHDVWSYAMGKRDRRNSLKMSRRKAQVKKKIRAKRPKAVRTPVAAPPVKKARAAKVAAPAAPAESAG
jgi:hypothetical protein